MVMPEVLANEAVMDPVAESEEEPRDSGMVLEPSPGMISFAFLLFLLSFADILFIYLPTELPEDSDDFEPSMDATFDDVSDELMEAESIPQSPRKALCSNTPDDNDFSTGSYSYLFVIC